MKIGVILGSVRKGRRGERVAKWIIKELSKIKEADFELLDLMDYPLPFYNEPNSPDSLEQGYSNEVAVSWAAKISQKDGFILLVAEYNHGPTAVLKNALDFVYKEWDKKPVIFVSYSPGQAGGIRAVEHLKQIVIELKMVPLQAAFHIPKILDTIDENGMLLKGRYDKRLDGVIKELLWWAKLLRSTREKDRV